MAGSAGAARLPEFKETDLQRVIERYDDPAADLDKPLYRCGEIVRMMGNPEQIAIVFDYRFDGKVWRYKVLRAHFKK